LSEWFANSAPESLCVVRLSAIGDTCHALAVIRNLQDVWPNTSITWIIGKTEASLHAGASGVEFIIFDKAKGRGAIDDVRAALKGRRFDAALCMHASWRANRILRHIPTDRRLGFDRKRARDFQWLFTNARVPHVEREHALEAMMGFARALGAERTPLRWDIPLSDADQAFAAQHCSYPTVAISPCTSQRSRNYRNWRVERFAEVARYAQKRYGCRVIVTGGPSDIEKDYGETLARTVGGEITNLVGQTTLKQSFALFAAADVVISPDSGPAHMATAGGTPVIGLYATSNPDRTGPFVSRRLTVNRYPEAVEKYLGKSVDDLRWGGRVRHPDAMDLIEVDDVTAKLDVVLGDPA
jgi:heptosyltransferase I